MDWPKQGFLPLRSVLCFNYSTWRGHSPLGEDKLVKGTRIGCRQSFKRSDEIACGSFLIQVGPGARLCRVYLLARTCPPH